MPLCGWCPAPPRSRAAAPLPPSLTAPLRCRHPLCAAGHPAAADAAALLPHLGQGQLPDPGRRLGNQQDAVHAVQAQQHSGERSAAGDAAGGAPPLRAASRGARPCHSLWPALASPCRFPLPNPPRPPPAPPQQLCFGDGGAPLILEGKAKAGCQPGKKGGSTSGCAPPDLVVGLGSQSDCRGRGPRASGSVFTSLSHYSGALRCAACFMRSTPFCRRPPGLAAAAAAASPPPRRAGTSNPSRTPPWLSCCPAGWIKGAVGRLRREAGSYGAYKVARKAAYPPKRGCKNVG